jgi:hypothetical protein
MRSHLPPSLPRNYRKLPWNTVLSCLLTFGLGSCTLTAAQVPPRKVPVQQDWVLQPGSRVGDYMVAGSLGDISIDLKGGKVRAPFDGKVEPTPEGCLAFTSPEVPAYLFRLCSVRRPHLGTVRAGQVIGRSDVLQFAAMRRQPDGTWAIVEPAIDVLERTVRDSSSSLP